MANKNDIQYITQFYVPGSEAPKVAPKEQPGKFKAPAHKYLKQEQIKVYVDPVALCSVVVAAAILIVMAVSLWQFAAVCEEHEAMESYLVQLQDENALLEHSYRSSYDLAEIEQKALALGMIPASEAQTLHVTVTIPVPEAEPTLWENIVWFFEGLFE